MIEKLDDRNPTPTDLKPIVDKINEIIDYINEGEKVFDVPTKTSS